MTDIRDLQQILMIGTALSLFMFEVKYILVGLHVLVRTSVQHFVIIRLGVFYWPPNCHTRVIDEMMV